MIKNVLVWMALGLTLFFYSASPLHADMGDVDGSGSISLADAILSLRVVAGKANIQPSDMKSADIDHDGKIGMAEALFALQLVSGIRPPYYLDRVTDGGRIEYRFIFDGHHFMTLIDENGTCNIRPRPGIDKNGWGSSWYAQPFLPFAVLSHTTINAIETTDDHVRVVTSGHVSYGTSSTYGTWTLIMIFTYNKADKKIVGTGDYAIALSGQLSGVTGDLNLYKIASNYLDDVPLLSGGTGDTGDMSHSNVVGDTFNFVWVPPDQPGHFPSDITDTLSIEVIGRYNNVDTAAQGYAPIEAAFKPSLKVKLTSPTKGLQMTFGGFYTLSEKNLFDKDNIGITPLIQNSSTDTQFHFDVEFESTALPGDGG